MPTLYLGMVERGFYSDVDLEINGAQLGELDVLPGDTDNTLTNALNSVDGVTATLSESGEITIDWSGTLVVEGRDPSGGGTVDFQAGTYE